MVCKFLKKGLYQNETFPPKGESLSSYIIGSSEVGKGFGDDNLKKIAGNLNFLPK